VSPHRIALVGLGRWGANILRDLRALACDVVVVDSTPSARRAARHAKVAHVVDDVADALGNVDGVVVATPVSTHEDVTVAALELGVPVFVEKPLAADPAAARRLADSGAERLFVMDKWRYHAGIRALHRIAASRELGEVVGLRTRRVGWGSTHAGDVDDVWALAPHDLAIALEILGRVPEPRAAVGWSDGTTACLTGLLGERPWFEMHVSGASLERRRVVELVCADGLAWLSSADDGAIGLARAELVGTEAWERRGVEGEAPLLAELRAFVDHLDGGPPPKSSAADGARAVGVIAELRALGGLEP
jgi:predicted dehydrogenase